MSEDLLTPREVAEFLRVRPESAREALSAIRCPLARLGKRSWRVSRGDLLAALERAKQIEGRATA